MAMMIDGVSRVWLTEIQGSALSVEGFESRLLLGEQMILRHLRPSDSLSEQLQALNDIYSRIRQTLADEAEAAGSSPGDREED